MNDLSSNDDPVVSESPSDDAQSQHHPMSGSIQKRVPPSEWQQSRLVIAGGKRWEASGRRRIYLTRKMIVSIIEEMEPARYGCPRRKLPLIPESIWMDCRTGQWGSKEIIGTDVITALRRYIGEPT